MAIYKHGQGFELETAKNKARESPERDLNLGLPDCESNALTIGHAAFLLNDLLLSKF